MLAEESAYESSHAAARQMTEMALTNLREANPQGDAGEALTELANKLLGRAQ